MAIGMGTTVKQINNLKLKRDIEGTIHVVSPYGDCLQEFVKLSDAEKRAKEITDFLRYEKSCDICYKEISQAQYRKGAGLCWTCEHTIK